MASRSALSLRPANVQEEAAAARGEKGRMAVSSKIAVGQENPASGQFGPLQLGSSKVPKGRSTESKAVVGTATGGEEEEVLWVLAREGSLKPDSKVTPLEIYPEETVEKAGKLMRRVVLPPWTPKTRLPAEEVDMILSVEPHRFVPPYDEATLRRLFPRQPVEETMEIMREAAEASEEARQGFLEYQDWVRGELEEKGYVEVPDKFIQDRAEIIDWMQEEVDQMYKSLNIPDRYFASASDDRNHRKEVV